MKYGIVFSGGGTCGAYQIGFWRALRESGFEAYVTGISGSSVGAMNALLFAQGDLEKAEKVWLSINEWDMCAPAIHIDKEDYLTFFSQKRLEKLIQRNIYDWKRIADKCSLYVVVSVLDESLPVKKRVDLQSREGGKAKYIPLQGKTREEITSVVLASAAIPSVYPNCKLNGERCADGDLSDKTPFLPLAEEGYDKIIVLHLNSREEAAERRLEFRENTAMDGKVRLYHLYPGESLGNFLLITRKMTKERMKRGYEDGIRFLKKDLK